MIAVEMTAPSLATVALLTAVDRTAPGSSSEVSLGFAVARRIELRSHRMIQDHYYCWQRRTDSKSVTAARLSDVRAPMPRQFGFLAARRIVTGITAAHGQFPWYRLSFADNRCPADSKGKSQARLRPGAGAPSLPVPGFERRLLRLELMTEQPRMQSPAATMAARFIWIPPGITERADRTRSQVWYTRRATSLSALTWGAQDS